LARRRVNRISVAARLIYAAARGRGFQEAGEEEKLMTAAPSFATLSHKVLNP
jgi:hypothetical protein